MSFRWLAFGVLLALPVVPTLAADEEQDMPSAELLEFLGSFETVDGDWIDPTDFELPLPGLAVESGDKSDE